MNLEKKNLLKNLLMEDRPVDFTQKAVRILLSITVYVSKLESQRDQMKIQQWAMQIYSSRNIGSEYYVPLDVQLGFLWVVYGIFSPNFSKSSCLQMAKSSRKVKEYKIANMSQEWQSSNGYLE